MSITIKYKGILNSPVLVTPEGRFPSKATFKPQKIDQDQALSLFMDKGFRELKNKVFQQEQERVLDRVHTKIEEINADIENLNAPKVDLIQEHKTALSDQSNAVTVSADNEASYPFEQTLTVIHPAKGAEVKSKGQNPIEPVDLSHGDHTFSLNINGNEKELTIGVYNSDDRVDTQEEFLQRLSRVINAHTTEITAQVTYTFEDAYDPAIGTRPMNRVARLALKPTAQGTGPDYYLTDSSGETFINDYGLDQGTPPQSLYMNTQGAKRTQSTNTLSFDKGHITGEVTDSTLGKASIETVKGADHVNRDLSNIIYKYNDLVQYLQDNADLLRPSLKDRVTRPTEELARNLYEIGLEANLNGKLIVHDKFPDKVTNNYSEVRSKVIDEKGWLDKLNNKLKQILELEKDAFAAEKPHLSPYTKDQAWDLLDELTSNLVINGYY